MAVTHLLAPPTVTAVRPPVVRTEIPASTWSAPCASSP